MEVTASQTKVSVDDNAQMVTITIADGRKPSQAEVRQYHALAGDLGYGIKFN